MKRRRKRSEGEDFQMAPMIDMVFLLLVFFMTVSTIAKDSRPKLELAGSRVVTVNDEAPARLILTLSSSDENQTEALVFVGSNPCDLGDLNRELKKHAEWLQKDGCLIRVSKNGVFSQWKPILEEVRNIACEEVAIAVFEGEL